MSQGFDNAIEPLRANLLGMLDGFAALRTQWGHTPSADSDAMIELAEQGKWAGDWGQKPIESAHSWAAFLLAASENQLRSMIRIVVGEPSLYGAQSLARSGLEMAARSYWLAEPSIGVPRRIGRFQTERLFNASELRRLGITGAGDPKEMTKRIVGTAKAMNMDVISGSKHPHPHVIDRRPGGNAVFQALLQDVGADGLGHTMFSYLSAVDHGTLYGLVQAVTPLDDPNGLGPQLAGLHMSSLLTNQLLGIATFGFGVAATRFTDLLGWSNEEWKRTNTNANRLVLRLLVSDLRRS